MSFRIVIVCDARESKDCQKEIQFHETDSIQHALFEAICNLHWHLGGNLWRCPQCQRELDKKADYREKQVQKTYAENES